MRIGIDLDGVAYPFAEEFTAFVSDRMGVDLPMFTHWNTHQKHWALTHDQLLELMGEALDDGKLWWSADPIDGFCEALWSLSDAGHKIVIATDRLQGTDYERLARQATFEWLGKIGANYDEIFFTADKREANADIFVDDRPGAVPTLILDGVDAVYFDRPWNQAFPYPRVHSWSEFVEYVEARNAA